MKAIARLIDNLCLWVTFDCWCPGLYFKWAVKEALRGRKQLKIGEK